jgi:hypothetical protein
MHSLSTNIARSPCLLEIIVDTMRIASTSCVTIIVLQILSMTLVCTISGMTQSPLMSGSAAAPPHHARQWRPTWFFPPEVVWSFHQGWVLLVEIIIITSLTCCTEALWSTQLGAANMYPSGMVPCNLSYESVWWSTQPLCSGYLCPSAMSSSDYKVLISMMV